MCGFQLVLCNDVTMSYVYTFLALVRHGRMIRCVLNKSRLDKSHFGSGSGQWKTINSQYKLEAAAALAATIMPGQQSRSRSRSSGSGGGGRRIGNSDSMLRQRLQRRQKAIEEEEDLDEYSEEEEERVFRIRAHKSIPAAHQENVVYIYIYGNMQFG